MITPGIYRHFKGNVYFVIAVAEHSETGEKLVVYFPSPGDEFKVWVRPLAMFEEEIDGVPRFKRITND